METRTKQALTLLIALAFATTAFAQTPLGTAFTYQGQLKGAGIPVVGNADFEFSLFDSESGGTRIGPIVARNDVGLIEGVFNASLDFGVTAVNGEARWLEIAVRAPAGAGGFTTLLPRQPLTPSPYSLQTRGIVVDAANRVGIGTSAPAKPVHVQNDEPVLILQDSGSNATQSGYVGFWNNSLAETAWFGFGTPGSPDLGIVNARTSGDICLSPGSGGNVGIGTFSPSKLLHVRGAAPSIVIQDTAASANQSGYIGFWNSVPQETGGIGFATPASSDLLIFNSRPNSNIVLQTAPGGAVRVPVLEIMGADVAERFPASEKLEPGMVVAIDPDHPGKLCIARGEYNRCVAGVVSGANDFPVGAVLGSSSEYRESPAVALSGRVYVICDASGAAIAPGDLLTSSDVPGHAMSAVDPTRSHGAIIGKAMTGLEKGKTGMVLVLVNLQ